MLVLTRKLNERILIGDDVVISVQGIRGDKVLIGIEAPNSISIHRQEVRDRLNRQKKEVTEAKPEGAAGGFWVDVKEGGAA